ncbi:hypothetical protein H0266_00810 [Halobacillus locisalis]|uniref:Uncharacterized protein n=1 Tax=Halobacillus locisalis TaxID=220753 RepID=A0A838CNB0_9BACI|nr:hypothetical protein [Halobacillus locisalis]MBA2173431.1 hypothetical protein [Halobacillus locisalis]
MSRFYRYRLPSWCRTWLIVIETSLLPILVFQALRTIFWPTTFDIFLLGLVIGLFLAFKYKWI